MNIREISNNYGLQGVLKKRNTEKVNKAEKSVDKIELSAEAKELQKAQYEQKIGQIRERINSDFYSQKPVIEKVATKILKDLEQ
jgi:preprotein translocase subunit SecD